MQQMVVNPCSNRLLVLLDEVKDTGVIITPEAAKKESQFGNVLAVGSMTNHKGEAIFYPAKAGQKVMVSRYGGVEVKVGDKTLKLYQCDDILATIDMVDVPDAVAPDGKLSDAISTAKVDVVEKP